MCISNLLGIQRPIPLCSTICSDVREKHNNVTKLKIEKFLVDINKISVLVTEFSLFDGPSKVLNCLNILLIFQQLLMVQCISFYIEK